MKKEFEVLFKVNGQMSGQFASALNAASKQMANLQKVAQTANTGISKETQNAMSSLAKMDSVLKKMSEYSQIKSQIPAAQNALTQQQAALEKVERQAQAATSEVQRLKAALQDLKTARQTQQDLIKSERDNKKNLSDLQKKLLQSSGYPNLARLEKSLQAAQSKNDTATVEKLSAILNQYKVKAAEIEQANARIKKAQSDLAAMPKNTALNAELKKASLNEKASLKAVEQQKAALSAVQNEVQKFAGQMQTLKGTLAGSGVDVERLASAEARLKSEINATTQALQRQAQAANLLSRYQSFKPQIDALKRQAVATDLKVRKSQARENVLGMASKLYQADLMRAWYDLSSVRYRVERLNNLNARVEPFKVISPKNESLAAVSAINKELAKGKTFGTGLAGAKNLLAAISAYKNLQAELSANQKSFQSLNRQTAIAARNYYNQQKAVQSLKGELDKYSAALKTAEKTLNADAARKAAESVKQIKNELAQAEQVLKQLSKVFDVSKSNGQMFKGNLREQTSQLQNLRSSLATAGVSVNHLATAENQLQSIVNATTQALQRQAQTSQQLAAAQERHNVAQSNLTDAQSNFQTAQNMASSIMSPFTSSVDTAKDFERQMSVVKALTQMDSIREKNFDKVNAEMAALTDLAKREGLRTQYSALDVAKGETYFGYAGWTKDQIEKVMPSTLDLGTAAGMQDLGRVVDITTDLMMALNVPVEGAKKFMDSLTYTFTHSNQNLEQLYGALKYGGAISVLFGSDYNEAFAMTKFMADSGIKDSMAGTAMRSIMTRLVAPPKTITKTMAANGITLDDANKEWANAVAIAKENGIELKEDLTVGKQMASVLRQINKQMAGKTSQEKLGIFKAITGLYALSGGANLFERGGKLVDDEENPGQKITAFEAFVRKLEKSEGSAGQTADVMRDNLWGATVALNSAWESFKIEMGAALTPTLKALAQFATGFVAAFARFNQEHPHIVQGIAAIAAGVSGLILTTAGLAVAFAVFEFGAAQIALFRAGLAGASVATAGLAVRLGTLAAGVRGLGIAAAIAPFLKISGWGAIGAGIAATFASLKSLGFIGILTAIFNKLKGAAMSVVRALKFLAGGFGTVLRAAMAFALSPIGLALAALGAIAFAVYKNWDTVKEVFASLSNTVSARLAPALDNAKAALSNAGESFGKVFDSLGKSGAADLLAKSFIVAVKVISQALIALVQFAANTVALLATIFGGLADVIREAWKGNWDEVKKLSRQTSDDMAKYAKAALLEPLKTIAQTPEDVNKALAYYDKVEDKNHHLISPTEAAARRHAVTFDKNGVAHSKDAITQEAIDAQVKALNKKPKLALPQFNYTLSGEEVNPIMFGTSAGDAVRRHSQEVISEKPKTISEAVQKSIEIQKLQPQAYQQTNIGRVATTPNLYTQSQKPDYGIDFWGFLSGLLVNKAAAATPESVKLNTEQAQAQLNLLGETAQINSSALQTNSATLQNVNSASLQLANDFTSNSAAVMQSSNDFTANSASVQQNAAAMTNAVPQIDAMSATAQNSTANINNMSASSASAASSISGLGSAAMQAISGLLSAAANAGSNLIARVQSFVFGGGVAKNAKGGIYNHGAFLTWFAEKSPEAAIPLDGSARAVNLWKQAGELLGVYPAENYAGGIYKQGGDVLKPSSSGGGVNAFVIEGLNDFVKAIKIFVSRMLNLPKSIEKSTQIKIPPIIEFPQKTPPFNPYPPIKKGENKKSGSILEPLPKDEGTGFNIGDIFNGKIFKQAEQMARRTRRTSRNIRWIGKNFNLKNILNGKIFKRIGDIFKGGNFEVPPLMTPPTFPPVGKNKKPSILDFPPMTPPFNPYPSTRKSENKKTGSMLEPLPKDEGTGFNIGDIFNGKIFKQAEQMARRTRRTSRNIRWIGKNFNLKNILNGKIFKRIGDIFKGGNFEVPPLMTPPTFPPVKQDKKSGGIFGGIFGNIFNSKSLIPAVAPSFPQLDNGGGTFPSFERNSTPENISNSQNSRTVNSTSNNPTYIFNITIQADNPQSFDEQMRSWFDEKRRAGFDW